MDGTGWGGMKKALSFHCMTGKVLGLMLFCKYGLMHNPVVGDFS